MSLSLEAALAYTRRGWRVIPVPHGEKNPGFTGWEDLRLDQHDLPQRFIDGENIGVLLGEPSGNLTDIDLDVPEAIFLAPRFLPETSCIFGRTSRPQSHWFYVTHAPIETKTFIDPGDPHRKKLVELRSTRLQTIVPPSQHSGEAVVFDHNGDPAVIDGDALHRAVARLAAATLLARAWPKVSGIRHDLSLALAGGFLHAGWTVDSTEAFVCAVLEAAGDHEVDDRLASIRTTEQKMAEGKSTTGWPTLAGLLDQKVIDRVREWLELASPGAQASAASQGRVSQATELVELALEAAEFFHTPDKMVYATIPVDEHRETWGIRSDGFRRWLAHRFYERDRKTPSGQAMVDALGVLYGQALFDGAELEVFTRIGEGEGSTTSTWAIPSGARWRSPRLAGRW